MTDRRHLRGVPLAGVDRRASATPRAGAPRGGRSCRGDRRRGGPRRSRPGYVRFLAIPACSGFSALGRRGLLAERVADAAVEPLLDWMTSGAAVDDHLAEQLVPFPALAGDESEFTCPTLSSHLRTVAWLVEQFLPARIELSEGPPARVSVWPHG